MFPALSAVAAMTCSIFIDSMTRSWVPAWTGSPALTLTMMTVPWSGDSTAATNQLNAFLNELQAYNNSNKVSVAAYNTLRADVHTVEAALGTYNRFLGWWHFPA